MKMRKDMQDEEKSKDDAMRGDAWRPRAARRLLWEGSRAQGPRRQVRQRRRART